MMTPEPVKPPVKKKKKLTGGTVNQVSTKSFHATLPLGGHSRNHSKSNLELIKSEAKRLVRNSMSQLKKDSFDLE